MKINDTNNCTMYMHSFGITERVDKALQRNDLRRVEIAKDGYCITSAWRYALKEHGYQNLSLNSMLKALRKEVLQHASIYQPWITGDLKDQVNFMRLLFAVDLLYKGCD